MWEERIRTAQTRGMEPLAPDTLTRWLSDQFRRTQPEVTDKIREMIVSTPVDGYVGCSRAIAAFDISEELGKVGCPTLIIAGALDESSPVSAAKQMGERIGGAEIAVMPGALHLSNIEARELFNQTVARFLAR